MDLHPTNDQLEVIRSTTDYLARELPADRLPRQTATVMTPRSWRGLAEMGWFGVGLTDAVGGLGLSVIEEALVLREFGRVLAPPSTLATVLAGHLAVAAGDGALVDALIRGERRAAFALPTIEDPSGLAGPFRLLDAEGADLFVVWTPAAGLLVDRAAFGDLAATRSFDASLSVLSAGTMDIGQGRACDDSPEFQQRARLLVAAMLTGGLEATAHLAVEYAKLRQQFGRPIGAFQAVSHACVDMAVDAEAAGAILQYAAVCVRDGSDEAELYSAAAKLVAGRGACRAAAAAMQVFGGFGQTYESLPHFYLKRAHLYQALCGGLSGDCAAVIGFGSTV
jgi:alkylation response protein AidB-like acyl-CoA dehydrogenase